MKRLALCALTAAAVAATGATAVQAKTTLKLRADGKGALKFNKETLRARPGTVTIRLTNPSTSGKPHAVEIEGKGQEKRSKVIDSGGTATVSIKLVKGTYEFYCPVGNHKAAGMEGKLIVK
ncbi:cupredoxin domain-containing protein [Solirubrobacter taibaiensis]|nr:cupredoxin domain-containing protein [Solirubrobacter taibaiensis]